MSEILQFLALVAGITGLAVGAFCINQKLRKRAERKSPLPQEFQEEDERDRLQRVMNEVHQRVSRGRVLRERLDNRPRTGTRGGRYTMGKTKEGRPYRRYF
jgi:hypothetical protein